MDQSFSTYLLFGVVLSIGLSAAGIALIGLLLVRLPSDYFCNGVRGGVWLGRHPVLRRTAVILKNLLGGILVAIGVVLSLPFVPGPGILTLSIGLMLLDFRDKRRWEAWLVTRPPLWWAINQLRQRCGKRSLERPELSR